MPQTLGSAGFNFIQRINTCRPCHRQVPQEREAHRPHKLRIRRFRLTAKALSLRCSSSPHQCCCIGGDPSVGCADKPEPQKTAALSGLRFALLSADQYMPSMPPAGATGAGGSGLSATRDSVVRTMAETEAAFSRAERVTFAGSIMPHSTMLQYSSL